MPPPPPSPPVFIRGVGQGHFSGIVSDITLIVCEYKFHLHASELIKHAPGMFSSPPDISAVRKRPPDISAVRKRPPQYTGILLDNGGWLLYATDRLIHTRLPAPIPSSASGGRRIAAFEAFFCVIYDGPREFWDMDEVREVYRLCCCFAAVDPFASYINGRFLETNSRPLYTLNENVVENIVMAEAIRSPLLYAECFVHLVGQIIRGGHEGVTGPDSILSEPTRMQLMDALNRLSLRYERADFLTLQFMGQFRELMGDRVIVSFNKAVSQLSRALGDSQPRYKSPKYIKRLKEVILAMDASDVPAGAVDPIRTEISACRRQLDELLKSNLLYGPETVDFFACESAQRFSWLSSDS